jgi:hypothetical protein
VFCLCSGTTSDLSYVGSPKDHSFFTLVFLHQSRHTWIGGRPRAEGMLVDKEPSIQSSGLGSEEGWCRCHDSLAAYGWCVCHWKGTINCISWVINSVPIGIAIRENLPDAVTYILSRNDVPTTYEKNKWCRYEKNTYNQKYAIRFKYLISLTCPLCPQLAAPCISFLDTDTRKTELLSLGDTT